MKALVLDGEELLRLSMHEVVSVAANFTEVIDAGSESDFIEVTAKYDRLDLVVIHPSGLTATDGADQLGPKDGNNCLKLVRRLYPQAAIVVISDTHTVSPSWHGATIVKREAGVTDMIRKIRRAMNLPVEPTGAMANTPAKPNVRAFIHDRLRPSHRDEDTYVDLGRLSFRQKQILAMAADGLPNKEIAARLGIAEGTVKAHMHAIFKVLDVSNRTQAVIKYGALNQIVTPAGGAAHQRAV